MKSERARRSEVSPNRTSFDKHSSFADRTHLSAYAFKWGLRRWELDRFDAPSLQRRELCIAIMQRVPALVKESPCLACCVAGHLLHPHLIRMARDPSQTDTATLQMKEEQDVISHPSQVRTSTVKKSIPANTAICDLRNSFQVGSGSVSAPVRGRDASECSLPFHPRPCNRDV
jgi:hypothetical protein